MAEYPFMPLATDAYLADTTHLSTIEHGAYFLLLMTMWRNGGALPNDDKLLARYAKLTSTQWRRIKPVLWPFFGSSPDGITQGRLRDEYDRVRQKSKTNSENANRRWLKNNDTKHANAKRAHRDGIAPTPTPTNNDLERQPGDCALDELKEHEVQNFKECYRNIDVLKELRDPKLWKWANENEPTNPRNALTKALKKKNASKTGAS